MARCRNGWDAKQKRPKRLLGSVVDGDPFEERLGALVLDADALQGLRDLDEEATGAPGLDQLDLEAALKRRNEQTDLAKTLGKEAQGYWDRYQATLQMDPPSARIGERNAEGMPQLQPQEGNAERYGNERRKGA